VRELTASAKAAAQEWRKSSFAQRRLLLKIILKFIVENQEEICRWAGRLLVALAGSV
jgi:acyl-CoA reductase-like NAD-dependent aldehyde dehydrogenase